MTTATLPERLAKLSTGKLYMRVNWCRTQLAGPIAATAEARYKAELLAVRDELARRNHTML